MEFNLLPSSTTRIPHKPIHNDKKILESGQVPVLDCKKGDYINVAKEVEATKQPPSPPAGDDGWEKRRRELMWTEEEHKFFLDGLDKYGMGEWQHIARYYVITRSASEVAYYAYNYFHD